MDLTQSNDEELFISLQQGDKKAFNMLFTRYYPTLCAYAGQFVGFEDAQEIVQDVMVWFWENRKVQIIEVSLKAYLFKMVKNKCITLINRNDLKQRVIASIHEKMKHLYEDPDFYVVEELSQKIDTALGSLPDTYRQAFELNRFHDMTYKDIADKLNISPKTVDYRIGQALKILRTELKDYFWIFFLLFSGYKI